MADITEAEKIAYTEVEYILRYLEKEYYDKVPKELINFFKANTLENYMYYDNSCNIKMSDLTKKILCYLNLEYWSNKEERERLLEKYQKNQQEIYKKYDVQNVFDKRKSIREARELTITNEGLVQKVIRKIKAFINRSIEKRQ